METNKKVFEDLFNNMNTYEELPQMLEKAATDVARSDLDQFKGHSICYHISGMVDIVLGAKKALRVLHNEARMLELDLENEMDVEQYEKYMELKEFFKEF